jgi:tRNA (guanine9-N1)-methyltransferase
LGPQPPPTRRRSTAADNAADSAADNANTDSYEARRVAYNRMRHERDRANRRERVQRELSSLSEAELEERREKGRMEAERRRAALAAAAQDDARALTIAIDCSFPPDGNVVVAQQFDPSPPTLTKSVRSLAKQLELSAAANKRSAAPARLHATSFSGPLAAFAAQMGAQAWPLFTTHERSLLEVFPSPPRRLVVLSPDASEPLSLSAPLERSGGASSSSSGGCVYVIGGIVDRTVKKGLTLSFAERHGLEARRLPVAELADRLGRLSEPGASKTPILNVSDVVACLLVYDACGDWVEALSTAMPARKLVAGVAAGDEEGGGGRRSRRRAVGRRRRQREEEQEENDQEADRL